MRYTNTPRYGRQITKMDQRALPPPDRSRLRKMSPKTEMRSQIQMKNRKKYSIDRKTCPVPNCEASIAFSLALEMEALCLRVHCPPRGNCPHHPCWVNGRSHATGPTGDRDHPLGVAPT